MSSKRVLTKRRARRHSGRPLSIMFFPTDAKVLRGTALAGWHIDLPKHELRNFQFAAIKRFVRAWLRSTPYRNPRI